MASLVATFCCRPEQKVLNEISDGARRLVQDTVRGGARFPMGLDGVQLNGVCLGFGLGFGFGHGARPRIDDLPRLPDRFGEGLLLIEVPPLAALVQLHEMTQCPARGEKLPLGMFVLHFGSQGFRHCASLTGTRKKTSKTGLVICLYDGDNATEGAQGGGLSTERDFPETGARFPVHALICV